MKNNRFTIQISYILSLLLFAQMTFAGGFRLEGSSADEAASAGAIVARSSGAMALFTNPANIGNLSRAKGEVVFGGSTLLQKGFYSNIGQNTWSSDKTTEFDVYGAVSYSFGKFAVAVGRANTYQHSIEWSDPDFVGRYMGTGQEMSVTETSVGGSVKVGNKWAFGLTLRNDQADFLYQINRPRPYYGLETFPEFFYDYTHQNEADDSAMGFSLGAFFTPQFGMKFALTYYSKVDFSFNGTHSVVQVSHLDDQRAVADFSSFAYQNQMQSAWSLPETLTLAASFKPTVRVRVEFDLAYENWSTNEHVTVETTDENGDDMQFLLGETWKSNVDLSVGAEFRQTPDFIWRGGLGYRLHLLNKEELTPGYPLYDRFTVSFGVSYRFGKNMIEFSYAYHQFRDAKVQNQEWIIDLDSPDYIISNSQDGLFESQKHHLILGYRRRF